MVCSRNPQRVVSLHPLITDQDILQRIVSVAHMQLLPVIFGGGITVVNGFLLLSTSAWKYLFSHHFSYNLDSISLGCRLSQLLTHSFLLIIVSYTSLHSFSHFTDENALYIT